MFRLIHDKPDAPTARLKPFYTPNVKKPQANISLGRTVQSAVPPKFRENPRTRGAFTLSRLTGGIPVILTCFRSEPQLKEGFGILSSKIFTGHLLSV